MSATIVVLVEADGRTCEQRMQEGSSVESLLRSMGLHPDAYIVTRGSKPVPITKMLEDGDSLRLLKVASGG